MESRWDSGFVAGSNFPESVVRLAFAACVAALAATAVACSDKPPAPAVAAVTPAAAPAAGGAVAQPADAPAPIPPGIPGPLGKLFDGYETVRQALAGDDGGFAASFGPTLVTASKDALDAAQPNHKEALTAIYDAAQRLQQADRGDIEAVRLVFGQLSRGMVQLLVADPALRQGRFLFECPMAKGYKRWVQTKEKLQNPYMGGKMLECGSLEQNWSV